MNTFVKEFQRTVWIGLDRLCVKWAQSQRAFNARHADNIASAFDPDLFDDVIVTLPDDDGMHHVADGQHRVAAARKVFGEGDKIPCRIVPASDPKSAAEIFERLNTARKRPGSVDLFISKVTQGKTRQVSIHKIATELGYRIQSSPGDGVIRAVNVLERIHSRYGEDTLKDTLMTVKASWGCDHHAVSAAVLEGVGEVVAHHRHHIDWKRFREQMAKNCTPASRLIGLGRSRADMDKCSVAEGVRLSIVRIYNHGLRRKKLED